MKAFGKVHKYGDDIDTDIIIPARYLNTSAATELAKHCMEPVDPDFYKTVQQGDVMVGGNNFGCGSSREHAPIAIKENGISCVIAKSFARIFYRNSINIGLPILECPEAADDADNGDEIAVDLNKGEINNKTKNKVYATAPFPKEIQAIIARGGLLK